MYTVHLETLGTIHNFQLIADIANISYSQLTAFTYKKQGAIYWSFQP